MLGNVSRTVLAQKLFLSCAAKFTTPSSAPGAGGLVVGRGGLASLLGRL